MAGFHFVHPGDLATRTGGYRYARSLLDALSRQGVAATVHRLADSFPFPDDTDLAEADRVLGSIPDGSTVVVDGLAFGAMPLQAARHAARLRLVALVHHPLALETGLDAGAAARLEASEREALQAAQAVVVTSPATALALRDYGVDASRLTVVLPGTEAGQGAATAAPLAVAPSAATPSAATPSAAPVRLLCVASVTPRKGQRELVEALAACRAQAPELAWRLVCIGGLDRDAAYADQVRRRVRELGLAAQVDLAGEHDENAVDRAYEAADAFVLASYHEGYGMVLAEAIAHGLPVVSTTAGAIPQTVPAAAALLVAPGDTAALAEALLRIIGQPELRRRMAAAARDAAKSLPDWDTAAERFLVVLQSAGPASLARKPAAAGPASDADQGKAMPEGFAASWLALREPHDHAARSASLTRRLAEFLRDRAAPSPDSPLRILDLACGTGSTLRYLSPRLDGFQAWTLVDNDARLLSALEQASASRPSTAAADAIRLAPTWLDLATDLERLPLAGVELVTASALLDLVSADWLGRLVAQACARETADGAAGAPPALLLALSYDGAIRWEPAHPDDDWVTDFFNRHQRQDKGFGPALGPTAATEAARLLRQAGLSVMSAPSPWRLGRADVAIQREFLAGLAGAARSLVETADIARLQAWLLSRERWLAEGASAVVVGHQDILALPDQVASQPARA